MSVVEWIRRNDPRAFSVTIHLNEDHLDAAVTEALEQNHHIICVYLIVFASPRNFSMLLRHLETRSNLHTVSVMPRSISLAATLANVGILLQAIQRNRNVRDFTMHRNVALGILVPFLNAATHLTHVTLGCSIQNNNDGTIGDGPAHLATSLQGISNLKTLNLQYGFQSEWLIAIFDCLKRKKSLETLSVDILPCSDTALASFKELMRSTSNIRELTLNCGPLTRETVLQAVKSNFSLRNIRNTYPSIEDERLLQFYVNRNGRMAQWIERPTSVPKHLHPEVLHVASHGNPSVLFRSLIAISGDLGTAKRKRKRPTYNAPSWTGTQCVLN